MQTVGSFIKEARESAGVSQWQLVNFINKNKTYISRRHLSNIELGNSGVSTKKLSLITNALVKFGAK